MFETDADRLAMIKSLGGLAVPVRGNNLWGIFDNGNVDVLSMVESSGPSFNCRTSDVELLAIAKDDEVDIKGEQFRVKKMDPDGTGMTLIHLKK
jgi:hypothetical protein